MRHARGRVGETLTHAVDAETLAELGALLQPACWTPPRVSAELARRPTEREALASLRQQVRNQHRAELQRQVADRERARPAGGVDRSARWADRRRGGGTGSSVRWRAHIGHSGNRQRHTAVYLATLSAVSDQCYTDQRQVRRGATRRSRPPISGCGLRASWRRWLAARTLLRIAWAVARKGEPFDPYHEQRRHQRAMT
jgi:hypothetical protein